MKLPESTTNAQLLTIMMQRLGDRKSPELRARVLFELNQRIAQLEQGPTLPWFLQSIWTFPVVGGQRSYALPGEFLRELEEGRLLIWNGSVALGESTKVGYEELPLETGLPTNYALFGESLYFGGVPDRDYTATLDHFVSSDPISDNAALVTNPWLINGFNYVSLYALRLVAQFHTQNAELAARFDLELRDAADRFWRMVETRQHINRRYQIED